MSHDSSRHATSLPAGDDLVVRDGSGWFGDDCEAWDTTLLPTSDLRRRKWEQALASRNIPITLQHRGLWQQIDPEATPFFGIVTSPNGHASFGFGIDAERSRSYPGFSIVRIQRFGGSANESATRAAVRELTRWARNNPVLRLHIEVNSISPGVRRVIAQECARQGFRRAPMRSYRSTVTVDLKPDVPVIFDQLHATARRHIRAVEKRAVAVRKIEDALLSKRMNDLLRESLERTGAGFQPQRFAEMIRFGRRYPDLVRVTGLFRTDRIGADALLAFAVAYHHGDHTEYGLAGCTRRTDVKMPLMYGIAWDLILWSRKMGAQWFDFGGIEADTSQFDATAGISDFKRYFGRDAVVEVGDEWILEPHPMRATVARKVGSVARRLASGNRSRERVPA